MTKLKNYNKKMLEVCEVPADTIEKIRKKL